MACVVCPVQGSQHGGPAWPSVMRCVPFHGVRNDVCSRAGSLGTPAPPVTSAKHCSVDFRMWLLTHPLTATVSLQNRDKKC